MKRFKLMAGVLVIGLFPLTGGITALIGWVFAYRPVLFVGVAVALIGFVTRAVAQSALADYVRAQGHPKTRFRLVDAFGGAARLTNFAAWLAGRKRHPEMQSQWTDHYLVQREKGVPAARILAGHLCGAMTIRVTDLFKPCWPAIDWVLVKDCRINTTVAMLCGAQTIYLCAGDGGLYGFLNGGELCVGLTGSAAFVLLRYLRKYRGVEIAGRNDLNDKDKS